MLNSHSKTIGFRIKVTRLYKGLTQAEVAKGLNCSRSKISKIETGEQEIEGSLLFAIADFFRVNIDEFNPKQNF